MIFSTSNESKRLLTIYLGISVLCGIFSFIYELFSHQVYSDFMVYAFTIPLVIGALPWLVVTVSSMSIVTSDWGKILQGFCVASLTVGSLLQGVLEIYGTTSQYVQYFFIVGFTLLLTTVSMWVASYRVYKDNLQN